MKILISDNNTHRAECLTLGLKSQWVDCQVMVSTPGGSATAAAQMHRPDLILLGIGVRDAEGLETLKHLREESDLPVIVLTEGNVELDTVKAFELGADDCVKWPCGCMEILARIKALSRRVKPPSPSPATPPLKAGDLTIDYATRRVSSGEAPVSLTPTEYRLLVALARHPDQVVPSDGLLSRVWGNEYRGETGLLKVHVNRLRNKIERCPTDPRRIVTERGRGYKFVRCA